MSQLGGVGASLSEGGAPGRYYGPPLAGPTSDDQEAYVRPALRLAPRAIAVPAAGGGNNPVMLVDFNPLRKSLTVSNALGTATVWIGDSPSMQVGIDSFAIPAGASVEFEPREYVGQLWAIAASGGGPQTVYVTEPA